MCNSYAVALLVKVSVEWIASVQEITHNSRYSIGTVHVIMLWRENRRVRRLWLFVFLFGREKGEHETQETGYEAPWTAERGKKGAEMPAFLWTTAFLFLSSSRFQSDVTNEPPKTANRAWMTTALRSTSFYTITTIAFNVCIKLLTNKDTHFLPAQHRSIPSMLLFPRSIGYLGSLHSFVYGSFSLRRFL